MFEEFCESSFWNGNISWNTATPELSRCLQSTFLTWAPCLFLWILLPFEVWQACQSKRIKLGWSTHSCSKLLLNAILTILSAMKLSCTVQRFIMDAPPNDVASILSSSVMCFTHVFILLATLHREQKGLRVSYILPFFWIFLSVSTWLTAYSTIQDVNFWWNSVPYNRRVEYVVTVAVPVVVTLQLILSAFAEPVKSNQFTRLDTQEDEVLDNCQLVSNSVFHYIFFMWMNRFMIQGMKGLLKPEGLPPLCTDLKSRSITKKCDAVERKYRGQGSSKLSLIYLLWHTCWKSFMIGCFFEAINIALDYLPPFMLQRLLSFVTSDEPVWHGYLYGIIFCLGATTCSLAYNLCDYCFTLCSMKCRIALTSAMYKKILRLSSTSRQEFPSGEILNMMSTDVVQIYSIVQFFSTLWGAPIRIAITQLYLWQYLGASSLASLVVMFVLICLSIFQGRIVEKLQIKVMQARDKRLKLVNEILNGIKILKLYAWELPFVKKVLKIREEELAALRTGSFLSAFFIFLWVAAPFLVCASCFASFILSGHTLDPATTFVSLSLIYILRFPMGMISHVIVGTITAMVSVRRVEKFLNCQEFDPDSVGRSTNEGESITLSDAKLAWADNAESFALESMNLKVRKGTLVAVVGSVGSGKSSLFSSLIGDMYKLHGTVNIQGTLAYVPQQAWIQNATLQKNILFTKPYSERKYNKLLDACALRADLQLLSGGDQTEIGEKGINLSGGQKQRVSLARAAYQDADIYLLDDPLSAVDANVASHIFKQLIGPEGFLRHKTCVFATHNLSFLPEVDHIVVLSEGRIVEEGSYSALMEKKGHLADLMQQYSAGLLEKKFEAHDTTRADKMSRQESVLSRTSDIDEQSTFSPIISEETMEKGRVNWSVYSNYASKTGLFFFLIIFLFNALSATADVGSGVWLSKWSDNTFNFSSPLIGLGIYCGFVGAQAFLVYFCYILLFIGTLRAATNLHKGLLESIIRAPLSFFDTTPVGRIVNRFSNDIETVDTALPWNWGTFLTWICSLTATLIVIIVTAPYLLILFVPLVGVYFFLLRAYVLTSNQLQRFSSVSNSPVMSCFTETIQGYGSIRAFNVQDHFIQDCFMKLDENNKCTYYSTISNKWLDSVLTMISAVITLVIALLAVWEREDIQPGMLGLILTYSIEVTAGLNWLVKVGAELESNIVAVERIQEYSLISSEDEWEKPDSKPPDTWPNEGEIVISDFCTSYREGLDLVLKNVNVKINSGAKIGIAGRTGAGKSSFILSLFRIIEPTGGAITIDGIDITKIGIHDLRSKLTIIPQDPVLFGLSLRRNLDPLEEYSDDQIWQALELAHLKVFVKSLVGGLDYEITEGGDNISAGQCQLVCLARALLRRTRILILDEATASVDLETDQLIQKTVEEKFADCTVITIAHRLQTIMKCNPILVFSEGQLIENDSPENLLRNTSSQFYSMAKDSGLVS